MLLLGWAYGCSSNKGTLPTEDEHLLDEASSQFTLFNEHIEIFIEHPPLEPGEETEFLVHATRLEDYKPFSSGTVSIEIDGVMASSGPPQRTGIFLVPFVALKAGAFDINISLTNNETVEIVRGHIHVEDHDETHAETHAEPEGEITFLKEQAWKSDFMVSRVSRGAIQEIILTSGELIPAPGKINRVSANIGGIVSFGNKNLVQGSHVKKGQHLFTISGKSLPENNFELNYKQASNDLQKSRSEYERHKTLHEGGAISERQFQESRSGYISDSLRYYSLAESTSEHGLKIFATATGSIHLLEVKEGDYIETGENMVTISSDRVLLLRADLPQQFHQQSDLINSANFRTAYSDETWSIDDFNGFHLSTGHSVAENDHYLPVYFELENDGRLLEGTFAEIYLKTLAQTDKTTIPKSALIEEQGSYSVYVQVSGESYTKRPISTGKSDGKSIEVLEGLSEGERIVTKGVILVKAASMITSVAGHGHAH